MINIKIVNLHYMTCLETFVTNYDLKTTLNHNNNKIIHWVSFNLYKDPKNHYKGFRNFKPFNKLKLKLKNNQTTWKHAYTFEKDNIEKY
jgi:hypothetical protein